MNIVEEFSNDLFHAVWLKYSQIQKAVIFNTTSIVGKLMQYPDECKLGKRSPCLCTLKNAPF